MKVRATKIPNRITLINNNNGTTEVQLSVNFSEIAVNGEKQYEGDVYRFTVKSRSTLYNSIDKDFDKWLEYAIKNDKSIESEYYLNNLKSNKITKSKELLENYLLSNPLTTNIRGKLETFSISSDKQTLMCNNYNAYLVEKAVSDNAALTWNATGEACEPITEEQMLNLLVRIKSIVNPLVSYQQYLEKDIMNCKNYKEVESIVMDFRSADIRYYEETNIDNN